jgi:hypothetical protein
MDLDLKATVGMFPPPGRARGGKPFLCAWVLLQSGESLLSCSREQNSWRNSCVDFCASGEIRGEGRQGKQILLETGVYGFFFFFFFLGCWLD